jgi:hypothetical protein
VVDLLLEEDAKEQEALDRVGFSGGDPAINVLHRILWI